MFTKKDQFVRHLVKTLLLVVIGASAGQAFVWKAVAQVNPMGSTKGARYVPGPEAVYFDAKKLEVITPGVLTVEKLSSNSIGNVMTILFQSGQVSAQTNTDPLVATWVGTVQVPVNPNAKAAKSYSQHVRGSINKSEDARVSLVFELGGKRFVTEFPYGIKHAGDFMRTFVSPSKPAMGGRYTATIFIMVERRDAKGIATVDIDSLDVSAKGSGARQTKRPSS